MTPYDKKHSKQNANSKTRTPPGPSLRKLTYSTSSTDQENPVSADESVKIGDHVFKIGTRTRFDHPVSRTPTQTYVSIPIEVIRGGEVGPVIWLSAAIHGDEINGVEIIRQVLESVDPKTLNGSIIAIPIVNVYGFLQQDRYLPDRRDLNRSFPGSARGSLASQIAYFFMSQIVKQCDFGIDLHTAAVHRYNLPQIRTNLDDERNRRAAQAFRAPVTLHSSHRDGSLRAAASKAGVPTLLYEAGETHRFNKDAVTVGVEGVRSVLADLGMITLPEDHFKHGQRESAFLKASHWLRASAGGIAHINVEIGDEVHAKEELGTVCDVFGRIIGRLRAKQDGIVIGAALNPLVNRGDALLHIGST